MNVLAQCPLILHRGGQFHGLVAHDAPHVHGLSTVFDVTRFNGRSIRRVRDRQGSFSDVAFYSTKAGRNSKSSQVFRCLSRKKRRR